MRNLELPGRSPVHAPEGMAATSHALATQTAVRILQSGGNAMDAAIAACAVQCVVEPGSTGIGGDNFCLYAPEGSAKDLVAFNGSGAAPKGATAQWFRDNGYEKIERDVHSVSMPAAIDAWARLHADHGRISWQRVLAPAIAYARDGFPMFSRTHRDFTAAADVLAAEPSTAAAYMPGGTMPAVGQVMRLPALAETLQKIADEGRDAFYSGEIAADMVEYLQSKGGHHTLEDFAAVQGDYVTPIKTDFRGKTVWQCPPNGQGVIALLLLNIAKGLPVDRALGPIDADRIHREIEIGRMAYGVRDHYIADPRFSEVPVEEILSPKYAQRLFDSIDPHKAADPLPDIRLPRHRATVYITVVDKDRNACSFINTLFYGFGSGLTAPRSGVLFQNRAMGFTLEEGHPNEIAPGKRPLHTIIPGMLSENGRVVMSYGVMGGHYQAFGHMQFLTRHFDYGMDIQEAMDAPRFMPDPFSGEVEMEGTVSREIQEDLTARGHTLVTPRSPVGGSQAIAIDWASGVLTGGSDPRKDGHAAGY
jgi:gamma-glutamyltranspeptidase/glutathione hydrolase